MDMCPYPITFLPYVSEKNCHRSVSGNRKVANTLVSCRFKNRSRLVEDSSWGNRFSIFSDMSEQDVLDFMCINNANVVTDSSLTVQRQVKNCEANKQAVGSELFKYCPEIVMKKITNDTPTEGGAIVTKCSNNCDCDDGGSVKPLVAAHVDVISTESIIKAVNRGSNWVKKLMLTA